MVRLVSRQYPSRSTLQEWSPTVCDGCSLVLVEEWALPCQLGHTPNAGEGGKDWHQCLYELHAQGTIPAVLLTSSRTCEKRDGLLPVPPSQNHSGRGELQKEEYHLRMVLRTNGYPEHVIQAAATGRGQHKKNNPSTPSAYYMDPTFKCDLQDTLQLQTDTHRENQENSWNPPQGTSSSQQTRRDGQVSNCRACLGKTTPPPMGQHHHTWPRPEPHHLASQGSITHRIGRATLTSQPRPGNSHHGLLETAPEARSMTWHQPIPAESKICTIEPSV